jgi:hypothetical protein
LSRQEIGGLASLRAEKRVRRIQPIEGPGVAGVDALRDNRLKSNAGTPHELSERRRTAAHRSPHLQRRDRIADARVRAAE